MKVILTYADLLTFEDLLRDSIAELRHRAEEFGHEVESVVESEEATMERLRQTIKVYEKEDL